MKTFQAQCNLPGIGSRYSRRARWLVLLLLAFSGPAAVTGETDKPPTPASAPFAPAHSAAAKPPWGRIVMVGASASAGFTESEPLGGPKTLQYRLSRYVDAALLAPHEPVQNFGDRLFFVQPDAAGRYQIELALQSKPTTVLGIDLL